MKKYIKPNTDIHNIEVVVMQATSPGFQSGTVNSNEIESKENTLPTTNSIWEEEE